MKPSEDLRLPTEKIGGVSRAEVLASSAVLALTAVMVIVLTVIR